MTIDFAGDLDEMFSSDDHGVFYTYKGETFEGIFNKEYYDQELATANVASSNPVLYVKATNHPNSEEGDMVRIGSDDYKIVHQEPDGQGLVMLVLNG